MAGIEHFTNVRQILVNVDHLILDSLIAEIWWIQVKILDAENSARQVQVLLDGNLFFKPLKKLLARALMMNIWYNVLAKLQNINQLVTSYWIYFKTGIDYRSRLVLYLMR